jgi:cystathionine beta-lyase
MDHLLFDSLIDRKQTGSYKWDSISSIYGKEDLLPMWIADMDFPSPKAIQNALIERASHPVYGYTAPSDTLEVVIQNWLKKHHQWPIEKEWITYSAGVVSGISTAIQAFTNPGDKILLQSPVYTPFFDTIRTNQREIANSPLLLKNGRFEIDFVDFENQLKNGVKLFLLCSPHNPGGRIWTKAELEKISELCSAYGVVIVSDEIHADLYYPPSKHTPIASISEKAANQTITLMAPSKTFNTAGMQASLIIASNENMRNKLMLIQNRNAFPGLNLFAWTAMEAAYKEGESWLHQLLHYLAKNIEIAEEFIAKELPLVTCMHPDASYLLWIDCRKLGLSDEDIQDRLIHKGKLALEPGKKYGQEGEGFVRMNIGCPRSVLLDGLNRLKTAFS